MYKQITVFIGLSILLISCNSTTGGATTPQVNIKEIQEETDQIIIDFEQELEELINETDEKTEIGETIDYMTGPIILHNFSGIPTLSSPYVLTGKAPRSRFFEGSFPVTLMTMDEEIITQTYATGDWLAPLGDNMELNGADMIEFTSNIIFDQKYINSGETKIQFSRIDMSGENLPIITEAAVILGE